jgi:hypothetical protein
VTALSPGNGENEPLTYDQLEAVATELRSLLDDAQKVLVFADGLAVLHTGMALADLYAEDCDYAQNALSEAGCHPRGREHVDLGFTNPLLSKGVVPDFGHLGGDRG